ncbi:4070_t:CDS:2, partial [Acaulospora colombiana]
QIYSRSSPFPHIVASIGPELDWPSEVVIQPHRIETQCLSKCGKWFATGGSSNDRAVFAIWDVRTADGAVTIHPCGSVGCSVYYIAFDQSANDMELRTRCKCQMLCRWDMTTEPCALLQEVALESERAFKWWANDHSKAISEEVHTGSIRQYSLNIFNDGDQIDSFELAAYLGNYKWIFSLGVGEKGEPGHVCFSPDTTTILYTCMDTQSPFSSSHLVVLLSSDDGTQLWHQSTDRILHVSFFQDGQRILIETDKSIYAINQSDGCVKQISPLIPLNVFISPTKDEIAIVTHDGVARLDPTSLHCSQSYPWTKPEGLVFLDISWMHLTIINITDRGHLDQSFTFFKLHPSKYPPTDATSEICSTISDLFLSPNGLYLLIRRQNASIQLLCTMSGNQIALTGDKLEKLEPSAHI